MIINGRRLQGMQAYKEKGTQDYMIVDMLSLNDRDQFEGFSASIAENSSSLSLNKIHSQYLSEKCRPVTWKQLPKEWQNAFLQRLDSPEVQFKESPKVDSPQKKLF